MLQNEMEETEQLLKHTGLSMEELQPCVVPKTKRSAALSKPKTPGKRKKAENNDGDEDGKKGKKGKIKKGKKGKAGAEEEDEDGKKGKKGKGKNGKGKKALELGKL